MEQMRARERRREGFRHTPLDSISFVLLCGHWIGPVTTHHACHHSLSRHPHACWRSLHCRRQSKIGIGGRRWRLSIYASSRNASHGRMHQKGLLPRDDRHARPAARARRHTHTHTHTNTVEHVTSPPPTLCGNTRCAVGMLRLSRALLPRAGRRKEANLDVPARGHGDGVLRQAVDALLPHGLL